MKRTKPPNARLARIIKLADKLYGCDINSARVGSYIEGYEQCLADLRKLIKRAERTPEAWETIAPTIVERLEKFAKQNHRAKYR